MAFTRTYDAQAAQTEVTAGASAPPLGYGWSDNLGMNLSYDSETEVATVTEENGAQVTFTPYDADTSGAWCTSATNFCAGAPRIEATLNHNEDGSWTYVRTTGGQTTFTFSDDGVLESVADSLGDTISSSDYSPTEGQAACPDGDSCESWTSSASGRELVVASNEEGRITSVFDANSDQAAAFAYSGTGCSSWSEEETPDLCSATDPGGLTSSYTYDSDNSSAAFDYDLLTQTLPGTASTTTNVYDTSGRISQQTESSGAVVTFSYAGTNSTFGGGSTTVTDFPFGTGSGEPSSSTIDYYSSNVLIAQTTAADTSCKS